MNFNRSTNLTDLDNHLAVANIIERGKPSDWETLLNRATESEELRANIKLALKMLEPETNSWAIQFWEALLNNIENPEKKQADIPIETTAEAETKSSPTPISIPIPMDKPISDKDWEAGIDARRETTSEVAPPCVRREEGSDDRRLKRGQSKETGNRS
jgi:hypothetical protein